MRIAPLLLSSLIVLAATGTAHAGGYISAGLGGPATPSQLQQDVGQAKTKPAGRFVLGEQFGMFSLEAGVSGTSDILLSDGKQYDAVSALVAAKLSIPVLGPLHAYGRVGAERNWVAAHGSETTPNFRIDYQGDGTFEGVGVELGFRFIGLTTSLWADYTRHTATLSNGGVSDNFQIDLWMAGASVGF